MSERTYEPSGFDTADVQRVIEHMNRCHREENLRLAQLAAGDACLQRVWATGFDNTGVDLLAETADGPLVLRLTFEWPALTVGEAAEELRRLYRAACRAAR